MKKSKDVCDFGLQSFTPEGCQGEEMPSARRMETRGHDSEMEIERKQKDVHANSRQQEKMSRFEDVTNNLDRESPKQIQSRDRIPKKKIIRDDAVNSRAR